MNALDEAIATARTPRGGIGLVYDVLRDSRAALQLDPAGWNLVLPVLREHGLLGRLACDLDGAGLLERIDAAVGRHLTAARDAAGRHAAAVRLELGYVHRALAEADIPFVLLKGAAYVARNVAAGRGRFFNDIDILVPEARLAAAEGALLRAKWVVEELDDYDTTYYRVWMHQIPPLVHTQRASMLDLHHAVVPRTSRVRMPTAPLVEAATPVPGFTHASTLAPHDMFLHSVVHLFCEEDLSQGVRDVSDLDRMIREFGQDDAFWERLATRVVDFDLAGPVAYAMHLVEAIYGPPLPPAAARLPRPRSLILGPMRRLFAHAIEPTLAGGHVGRKRFARYLLYVRGHYLKMPLPLLIRHLWHKATSRRAEAEK